MRKTVNIFIFTLIFFSAVHAQKDIVVTIPKTGTNLLIKCVNLIKQKYGDIEGVNWHHEWKSDPNVRSLLDPPH